MRKYAIWTAYSVMFLLFLFKMFYYREELYDVPDEAVHISYLAYVQENPDRMLPEPDGIRLCGDGTELEDGIYRYTVGSTVCSRKNPPLYYRAMQLVGGVITQETDEGHFVYMDRKRLRTANLYLTAFAMLLMLYLGYTRLGGLTQSVLLHGAAALAMTSAGRLAEYGACVENGNLTNIGTVLLVWGVLKVLEKRKKFAGYFLAAAGIVLTLLSGLSLRGYLPFAALAAIAGLQWLLGFRAYRLWRLLGYKAKARRLQREGAQRRNSAEQPFALVCILTGMLIFGGFGLGLLAGTENSVYNRIYELDQKQQRKKQGYLLVYADTGEKAGDIAEVGYLLQGLTVEQDFEVTEEMLAYSQLAIAMRIGTYDRKNEVPLYVEIFQDSGFGKAYRVDCAQVKNGQYVKLLFSTEGLNAETVHVRLYSEATNGNQAVTVYTTKNCILSPSVRIAGADRERNLVMRVFTPYEAHSE